MHMQASTATGEQESQNILNTLHSSLRKCQVAVMPSSSQAAAITPVAHSVMGHKQDVFHRLKYDAEIYLMMYVHLSANRSVDSAWI